MKINSEYGKIILRISLSLVFLWFGINQLYSPSNWTVFVPKLFSGIIASKLLVMINGSFEVIFGLIMISGIYLRLTALLLSLHLIGISFSLGYSALAVRDLGLSLSTLSIFFLGPDKWCFDKKEE